MPSPAHQPELHIPEPPKVRKADSAVGDLPKPPPAKKRRAPRNSAASKGLRHFSMKVCQKVESKGKTTYNEVADELVKEFALLKTPDMKSTTYDEKNIRRRVYDALNVLMAMDIIAKERKEISWRGLPSNSKDEVEALRHAHTMATRAVETKKEHLKELLLQQIAFKKLLARNQARMGTTPRESRIHLPFIVISTSDQTTIQLEMDTPERRDLFFSFSAPFEIHDDHEILMRMNLHRCSPDELQKLVPQDMVQFLPPDMVAGNLGAPGASGQPSQLDGSQYSHPTSDAQAAAAAVQHAMPEYDDALLADTLVSDDQGASASFHSNGAGLPDFLAASPPRSSHYREPQHTYTNSAAGVQNDTAAPATGSFRA